MPVTVKQLDVRVGDVVEIGAWRYDVVSNPTGGVMLEPMITQTVAEIHEELGVRALSARECGDLPVDGEG